MLKELNEDEKAYSFDMQYSHIEVNVLTRKISGLIIKGIKEIIE